MEKQYKEHSLVSDLSLNFSKANYLYDCKENYLTSAKSQFL